MSGKNVVIATTFRDFLGTDNDEIQHRFLKSLKGQTHHDWRLAVTVFGEKNVVRVLEETGVPYAPYHSTSQDCRFSLSEVLLNGAREARRSGGALVWTTCDVMFEPDFLKRVLEFCRSATIGTSHPHCIAPSIESYEERSGSARLDEGFDTIFFSPELVQREEFLDVVQKYRFRDWGVFEHFLTGVGQRLASRRVNIWAVSPIWKVANDRALTQDTKQFLDTSWKGNMVVLQSFTEANQLSPRLASLYYCHTRFRPVSPARMYRKFWWQYLEHSTQPLRIGIRRHLRVRSRVARATRLLTSRRSDHVS